MKPSILIVDDNYPIQHALNDAFERAGFATSNANNGEDGLRIAKKQHPDIVLADIEMPRMDGLAMLNELRRDQWGATANVLFLTNHDDFANVEFALQHGVHGVLVKSNWSMEEIVKKVKEILNPKSRNGLVK